MDNLKKILEKFPEKWTVAQNTTNDDGLVFEDHSKAKFPIIECETVDLAKAVAETHNKAPLLIKQLEDLQATFDDLVGQLPKCSGKWTGGPDKGRIHTPCGKLAWYVNQDYEYAYCKYCIKPLERDTKFKEVPWFDWVKKNG